MHVLIVHDQLTDDARPDEADALVQARAVAEALRSLGHTSVITPVSLDLASFAEAVRRHAPEMVFNLVESLAGHGRLIHLVPAVLDALAMPYTGAPSEAVYVTSHKVLTKRLLAAHGLATPPWLDLTGASADLVFPARYIVKSIWEDASLGLDDDAVFTCRSAADLGAEVGARAGRLGGAALAEAYIEGREFNLAVLGGGGGPEALPAAEIEFVEFPPDKPRIVGYAAKWHADSFEYAATVRRSDFPPTDADLLAHLRRAALDCWRLFGLRGYARVDFRVDAQGRPWVLEVNANPCLSPDAGFMAAAARAGLDMTKVVERIVADAVRPIAED